MIGTEVVPGVVKLQPRGLRAWLLDCLFDIELVSYLVDGILIDTGGSLFQRGFRRLCRDLDLVAVVNTHCHEEHIGNNGLIQRLRGVPCLTPGGSRGAPRSAVPLYRRLLWGAAPAFEPTAIGEVVAGRTLAFEVIDTPGHCAHHVCLFEREKGWLFSGDVFTHEDLNYSLAELDGDQLVASLRKLVALPVRLLFDAHGRVLENPRPALERKLEYLLAVRAEVRTLGRQGTSPAAMVERLFGRECLAYYMSAGDFSRQNFLRSFLKTVAFEEAGALPASRQPGGGG